jgi:hypothetical protein
VIGIYIIYNVLSGHCYIGSSNNIKSRWQCHRRDLRNGKHHSRYLQSAWEKYGPSAFVFEVIEQCDTTNLFDLEQFYIDTIQPEYNISKDVNAPNPPPNRPIVRIDMKTGESVEFATRDLAALEGFNEGSITACCHGHMASHRGYLWQFADGTSPKFITTRISCSIIRSDLDGGNQCIFDSISAAVRNTPGATYSSVYACCRSQLKSHNGYLWSFNNEISSAVVPKKAPRRRKVSGRCVRRISCSDGTVFLYPMVSAVSGDGYSVGNVISCCEGTRRTHKGCFWEWGDSPLSQSLVAPQRSKGRVIGTSIETGEQKEYPDTASTLLDGFMPNKVSLCCLGRRKSHGGYTWRRV